MLVGERGVKPGSGVNPRRSSDQRSPAFNRRRARRGGESGFGRFGNQTSRGGWLWVAGNMPPLLVESVGVGAAGIGAGDDLGGRRSSGEVGVGVRGHGRGSWCVC